MVCATTKKNGNKYYYYKCEHCKTYFSEIDIEEQLKCFLIELNKQDELINDYIYEQNYGYEKDYDDLDIDI